MDSLSLDITMSHLIASDAPILSPSDSVYSDNYNLNYNYYLPPSPPHSVASLSIDSPGPPSRMLKARLSPDSTADSPQLCLPTHQLFDFPAHVAQLPTPPSPTPSGSSDQDLQQPLLQNQALAEASEVSLKREASPALTATKKRAIGERISSKDFIPPDVSGLSKREARLVKNRAAAFLSRQRKREEFECMEVRVTELEQENARLLALTQNGNSTSVTPPDPVLVSEIEQLKAQLAAAKEREIELSAELASKSGTAREAPIKIEASENQFPLSSPPRSSTIPSPNKSGASLGLMVLLCALPTLLSMPVHSTAPTSFSLPTPLPTPASSYDFNSYMPNEYDWTRTSGSTSSLMDLDADDHHHHSSSTTRRLEFSGVDATELGALSGLDISFDTSPSDNGKIVVRIHPSSSASSRAGSPDSPYSLSSKPGLSSSSLGMWAGSEAQSAFQNPFASPSQASSGPYNPSQADDPFLGIGAPNDFGLPFSSVGSSAMFGQLNDLSSTLDYQHLSDPSFGLGSEYTVPDAATGGKRRVRIALKSLPTTGGEGGEWEVQFC